MSKSAKSSSRNAKDKPPETPGHATRETVESIVVAVILAFLFRAFVAEAFVIPTGSMAPTLQGRHKDVKCEKCEFRYRTGASIENKDTYKGDVTHTICPMCRYTMKLDLNKYPNQRSFTGDRILVSKFAYDLGTPKRWDVIVFKFPGNAKQNYIKRLVGLPREAIRIKHGDVFVKGPDDADYHIARKIPNHKLLAMLQLVHDSEYIAEDLAAVGWPSRWQPWSPETGLGERRSLADDQEGMWIESGDVDSFLRYHHFIADENDWKDVNDGFAPDDLAERKGQLIGDYYEYNAFTGTGGQIHGDWRKVSGVHWVGDLAIEANVEVEGSSGELILDLVEAGTHYQCRIDVANGTAALSIDDGRISFKGSDSTADKPTAKTKVRGAGRYRLRFSNVDDELRLWVNNKVIAFDGPTTYETPATQSPFYSVADPGDLAPAGIGARQVAVKVNNLRILRDVYYTATKSYGYYNTDHNDYEDSGYNEDEVAAIFRDPDAWSPTDRKSLFDSRRAIEFNVKEDQFFPMGDNSPQSSDARFWDDEEYGFKRELLTGKALVIYWPHTWRRPIPFMPNFARMGFIR